MAIESYADLQTRMTAYMKRADLTALFPDFIMLAEESFDREVFTRARRTSYIFTPNQTVVPMPSDWKKIAQVWYNGVELDFISTQNDSTYANGQFPAVYNGYQIIGNNLVFTPPSNQLGQKMQIDYYPILEPLSDSNTSNWLLEDSPSAYLYGALAQGAIYTRDAQNAQIWASLRDNAIQAMIDDDESAKRPTDGSLTIKAG
jgi:hypothetical protein